MKVLFLPTNNIPIIAHRKREEKLIEKCLETWPSPLSQPSRQPSVQGSKLTTMNLRVMPVALAENKTQPSGWVRSASGSDKKTAASRLRFEIYWVYSPPLLSLSLSLFLTISIYVYHPRVLVRTFVFYALWISPSITRVSIAFAKDAHSSICPEWFSGCGV